MATITYYKHSYGRWAEDEIDPLDWSPQLLALSDVCAELPDWSASPARGDRPVPLATDARDGSVTTGDCGAGARGQNRKRHGNATGEATSSTYFDRPHLFGPRRAITFGLRVEF